MISVASVTPDFPSLILSSFFCILRWLYVPPDLLVPEVLELPLEPLVVVVLVVVVVLPPEVLVVVVLVAVAVSRLPVYCKVPRGGGDSL